MNAPGSPRESGSEAPVTRRAPSRRRRIAFVSLAILFAFLMLTMGFGLIDLASGFSPGPTTGGSNIRILSAAYGIIIVVMIIAGALSQVRAPERKIAGMQQVALAVVALAVAGLISTDYYWQNAVQCEGNCGAFYIVVAPTATFTTILVILHPKRSSFFSWEDGVSPVLAGLAALGAIPWLAYAAQMAANQRASLPPLDAGRNGYGGWTGASAMAIGIVVVSSLASMGTRGWRIPAWSAGAAAFLWGLLSTISPTVPGSGGQVGGALAMIWGILLIAAAEREARRRRSR
jgi:MFS family permease